VHDYGVCKTNAAAHYLHPTKNSDFHEKLSNVDSVQRYCFCKHWSRRNYCFWSGVDSVQWHCFCKHQSRAQTVYAHMKIIQEVNTHMKIIQHTNNNRIVHSLSQALFLSLSMCFLSLSLSVSLYLSVSLSLSLYAQLPHTRTRTHTSGVHHNDTRTHLVYLPLDFPCVWQFVKFSSSSASLSAI